MSLEDISPATLPFDRYIGELPPFMASDAIRLLHCVAAAKRMLLQERVRDFGASDVIALADILERMSRVSLTEYQQTAA
ncbi:hypothetical protein D3C87_1615040 [compost metagenome]